MIEKLAELVFNALTPYTAFKQIATMFIVSVAVVMGSLMLAEGLGVEYLSPGYAAVGIVATILAVGVIFGIFWLYRQHAKNLRNKK
jgi:hypothetical protein